MFRWKSVKPSPENSFMLPGASFQKYVGGFLSRSWTTHIESHNRWKGTLRTFEWPRWFHSIDMWICCVCLGGSCISLFHSCFYFHINSFAFSSNQECNYRVSPCQRWTPGSFVIQKPLLSSGFLVPSSTSIDCETAPLREVCLVSESFPLRFRAFLRAKYILKAVMKPTKQRIEKWYLEASGIEWNTSNLRHFSHLMPWNSRQFSLL